MNPAWIAPVVFASLATYVASAIGLSSSVPIRIPYLPALGVALAGSFVNRLAPVKVAGAALNIRFLQKRGASPLTAVAGAGVIAVAGGISHVLITLVAVFAAGSQDGGLPFKLPDTNLIIAGVVGILIVVGVLLWIPRTAQLIRSKVLPALLSTRDSMKESSPPRARSSGCSSAASWFPSPDTLCLHYSVQAFGGGLALAQVAVVFLTIGTIAGAAPTPGGVGVVEAALIGGLTGLGLDADQALASVFFYRLATFWLPVLPGWGAFALLQRNQDI